ncbi:MAG: LppM family (lipo)protein [Anaerolineae bacterium]
MAKHRTAGWLALSLMLVLGLAGCADLPQAVKPDVHVTVGVAQDGKCLLMGEVALHPLVDPLIQQGIEILRAEAAKAKEVRNPEVKVTEREGRRYHALLLHFNSPQDLNAFVGTPYLLNALLRAMQVEGEIPALFSGFEVRIDRDPQQAPTRFSFTATIPEITVQALSGIQLTFHVRLPGRIASHNADSVNDGNTATWKMPPNGTFSMRAEANASTLGSALKSVERVVAERPLVFGAVGGFALLAVAGLAFLAWYKRQSQPDAGQPYDNGGPLAW